MRKIFALFVLTGVGFLAAGCDSRLPAVRYSIEFPSPSMIEFEAELLGPRRGIYLDDEIALPRFGRIWFEPETPEQGFRFGFLVQADSFIREAWEREGIEPLPQTSLPEGVRFSRWVQTELMEIPAEPQGHSDLEWKSYLGGSGRFVVAAAAFMPKNPPPFDVEYTFLDQQRRVIFGVKFFKRGGGVFVGTDLTPFLPRNWPARPIRGMSIETRVGFSR